MKNGPHKLLTIVTESTIERVILDDLESLGVRGYTVTDVRGKGVTGLRDASIPLMSNIKIEIVEEAHLVDKILKLLAKKYYKNYAIFVFVQDVEVFSEE